MPLFQGHVVKAKQPKHEVLIFLGMLCVNPAARWEAPGTGRTCDTG